MQERDDISRFALEALRMRITRVFPAQIRSCIEELSAGAIMVATKRAE